MTVTSNRLRRAAAMAALTGLVVAGSATAAGAHSATPTKKKPKPPSYLTVVYQASGSSLVAKPNSTVAIGPTTLTSTINNQTDAITGSLPIPDTAANFKILGLLPVTATASFIANGPVTGQLNAAENATTVTSTASYYLKLSNVSVAGIPTSVGTSCQTTDPVTINAATPAGQTFNVFTGGNLTATYTIGNFANCGLTTGLINLLVPGPNNTLALTLSDGQLQPPTSS